jgi:L-asparaginase
MRAVVAEACRDAGDLPAVDLLARPPLNSGGLDAAGIASVLRDLARRVDAGACGAVITMGTDTLEEVAFLADLLWWRDDPIVVVGAMRHEGKAGGDGAANLRAGIRVAAHPSARGMGCLVVLDGEIHQAWQVRKGHTSALSAFQSAVYGPIGTVFEDTVRITGAAVIDRPVFTLGPSTAVPAVALLTATLADDGRLLTVLGDLGYRGLVVEAMGGGSVPPAWSPRLERLAAGMPVVYSSRTGAGPTLRSTYGGVGAERDLQRRGMVATGLLDGLKARVLLGLLLAVGAPRESMAGTWRMFDTPATTGRRRRFIDPAIAAEGTPPGLDCDAISC